MILVSIQYYICRILLTGCHMTGGQPHRQPQFDKFVMIFVTEKGVKTFRGNHNQSAASYSLKDDSSTIDKASGCMIRNSPCILLGKDFTYCHRQGYIKLERTIGKNEKLESSKWTLFLILKLCNFRIIFPTSLGTFQLPFPTT